MTYRILIVDDEEGMQLALSEVLKRGGYEVSVAANGREGLEYLKDKTLHYDLVLSDIRMPEMDGNALLAEIKKLDAAPPVIIMTAFGTIEDAVNTMRDGARDYLLKPFSTEAAEQVIRRVLEKEASAEENVEEKIETTTTRTPKTTNKKTTDFIAGDDRMKQLIQLAEDIADTDATVLILGESGTGKEVMAKYLHDRSARQEGPFVAVNCASVPDNLLESEMFGHVKGSFTGATLNHKGHFERANHGTILLDEISEMPLALQAKLLRVLQEREIQPVGSDKTIPLDLRVLATSNRKMEDAVADGGFREDLFYRLNVITIDLPALRDRKGDILKLANYFMKEHARRNRRPAKKLGADLERHLLSEDWKGNVRQLENFMERAVLLCKDEVIQPDNIFLEVPVTAEYGEGNRSAGNAVMDTQVIGSGNNFATAPTMTLEEMERQLILATLEKVDGNRTRAADLLGVSVRTIRNKLNQYGLAAAAV